MLLRVALKVKPCSWQSGEVFMIHCTCVLYRVYIYCITSSTCTCLEQWSIHLSLFWLLGAIVVSLISVVMEWLVAHTKKNNIKLCILLYSNIKYILRKNTCIITCLSLTILVYPVKEKKGNVHVNIMLS